MADLRVVVATNGYGGQISAPSACEQLDLLLKEHGLSVRQHPMSDGGTGFLEALGAHREMDLHGVPVPGPLGQHVFATAGRLRGTWVVEAAQAIGQHLCGAERMPGRASSEGLGWLLNDLVRRETGPLIIGLGGDAAVDGGLGLACALGLTALDSDGHRIGPPWGATALTQVRQLVGPPPLSDRIVQVLCNSQSTLNDSIKMFGPDKGVHTEDHAALSTAYSRWADTLNGWRSDHGDTEVSIETGGGGAGGGIGFALHALMGAHLTRGATRFARMTDLTRSLVGADLIVTGQGPTASVATNAARAIGATVIAIADTTDPVAPPPEGPDQVIQFSAQANADDGFKAALSGLIEALLAQRP